MSDTLAVLGGPPAFPEPLHVGRPNLGDRAALLARIGDVLDRRWLTNDGPLVREFEARVAALLGVRHCVATCNATTALEILARALGLTGEVIVPSFTFVATAHALRWLGLTPVFADIDPATHCLDPAAAERVITPQTSAIFGVHVWGTPCAVGPLTELAARHRLTLVFDAAHAFGCGLPGRMAGTFGAAEVLSFHATKFVNTLEGGAVVTDDDALAARVRLMRNFGFAGYDTVVTVGTNGKMNEVSAAVGLSNLDAMAGFVAANRRNYAAYRAALAGVPGVKVFEYPGDGPRNYQYAVTEVGPECPLTRDELVRVLWAENVIARRYFYPGCHRMEPYRTLDSDAGRRLPHTEALGDRVLLLPTGTAIGPAEVGRVAGVVRAAAGAAAAVRRALLAREAGGG